MRGRRRLLAIVLAAQVAGCGWTITPPAPLPAQRAHLVADRVILKLDTAAMAWGGTGMGEAVRDALLAAGSFREIYYPIEPRNPPTWTLAITGRGTIDEHEVSGFFKAVLIGALFFLPEGVVRFDKTFHLDADVVLRDGQQQVARFQVSNDTEIHHTMFSHMEEYEPAARKVAFTDLGQRIAAQLDTVTPPAAE